MPLLSGRSRTGQSFSVRVDDGGLRELGKKYKHLNFANTRVGMRRSLGAFRREFIKGSPIFRGKGRAANAKSATASQATGKSGLEKTLRWVVGPKGNTGDAGDLKGRFWTDSFAAYGLETGDTYRPRSKKFLVIPIGIARTGRGKTKKQYRDFKARLRARGRTRFRFVPFRSGNGYRVYERTGAGGSTLAGQFTEVRRKKRGKGFSRGARYAPVYHLVREAKPKTKLNMFREWERFRPEVLKRMAESAEKTLRGERAK